MPTIGQLQTTARAAEADNDEELERFRLEAEELLGVNLQTDDTAQADVAASPGTVNSDDHVEVEDTSPDQVLTETD